MNNATTEQVKYLFSDSIMQEVMQEPRTLTIEPLLEGQPYKIAEPVNTITVTREVFRFAVATTIPMAEIIKEFGEDYEQSPEMMEELNDYLSDAVYDLKDELENNVTLLNTDNTADLYFHYLGHRHEYYVFGDTMFVRGEVRYDLAGEAYRKTCVDLDLRKFLNRQYDENGKAFIAGFGNWAPTHNGYLDHVLFRYYVYFKFLERIIEPNFNPFREEDGLIHCDKSNFKISEVFNLPKELQEPSRMLQSLVVAREYHDFENFNV